MAPATSLWTESPPPVPPAHIEKVESRLWLLLDDWDLRWRFAGHEQRLLIRAPFYYDKSSVPLWLQWATLGQINNETFGDEPPLPHDAQYVTRGNATTGVWFYEVDGKPVTRPWTRKRCDRLFCRLMKEKGIEEWKRRAAYRAVRSPAGYWAWITDG